MELIASKKPVLNIFFQSYWLNTGCRQWTSRDFPIVSLAHLYILSLGSKLRRWRTTEPHYLWVRDKGRGINLGDTIEACVSRISFKQYSEICALAQHEPSFPWIQWLWWRACSHLLCHSYRVAKAALSLLALPSHAKLCAWSVLIISE